MNSILSSFVDSKIIKVMQCDLIKEILNKIQGIYEGKDG